MIFTKDMHMSDIIHENHLVLSILERFKIKLGFGNKTIDEVCSEQDLDVNFFLEVINTFLNNKYFPEQQLKSFSIKLIINYLRNTHRYYVDEIAPQIEAKIKALSATCSSAIKDKLHLLEKFYEDYRNELNEHIAHEDKDVYPYAIMVEEYYNEGKAPETFIQRIKEYSISEYSDHHNSLDEKLYDLKNLIIKYLPAPRNSKLCNSILIDLFELEKDLKTHDNLENRVLVPKIQAMEDFLLNSSNAG